MKTPKTPLRLALVLSLTLTAVALADRDTVRRLEPRAPALEYVGLVDGWRLEMDGVLYLRLRTSAAEEAHDAPADAAQHLWFRMPPMRSVERDVENMLLSALSALGGGGPGPAPLLEVHAEGQPNHDGSTPEAALTLVWIERS